MIWERENQISRPVDPAMVRYVQDAVVAKLEYRRRMHELDCRLTEIGGTAGIAGAVGDDLEVGAG